MALRAPTNAVSPTERITEEHRLIRGTTEEFVDHEVLPGRLDRLEKEKDWRSPSTPATEARARPSQRRRPPRIIRRTATRQGHVDAPSASTWRARGVCATFGARPHLTILPLTLFGTDGRSAQYLPRS